MKEIIPSQKWINILDKITEYALYGLCFFIPISTGAVESFFALLLLSFIVKKVMKPDLEFIKSPANVFLLLFIIFMGLSLFNSGYYLPKSLIALFFKWLKFIWVFVIAQDVLNNKKRINNIIGVLLFSSFLVALSGLSQKFLGIEFLRHKPLVKIDGGFYGVSGPFNHYNGLGSYLVVCISFAIVSFLAAKQKISKFILFALSILLLACLILTLSRGAWLASLGALAVILIASRRFKIILIISACIFLLSFSPGVRERTVSTFRLGGDTERLVLWKGTWAMIKDNPLLGKGVGTFMDYCPKYVPTLTTRYAHNCFLQIWAESGIFSLLSFLGLIISVLFLAVRKFLRTKDYYILGAISALFGFLIHSSLDALLYSLQLAMLFWLILGISLAKISDQKN